jgi:hypothetical protein
MEAEMHGDVQSLAGDFSRHRMPDLIRELEAERLAHTTRRARLADSRSAPLRSRASWSVPPPAHPGTLREGGFE